MSKITWDNRKNSGSKSSLDAVIFNETKTSTNALYDIIEARLGNTSSLSPINLTPSGNLFISGNLLPNVISNNPTSSFNLGGENNIWKEVYIGPTTINYVDNEGNITSLSQDNVKGIKAGSLPVSPKNISGSTFTNWESVEAIFSKETLYNNINLQTENEIKFVLRNNPGVGGPDNPFFHIDGNTNSIHIGNKNATTTTYLYDKIKFPPSSSLLISGNLAIEGTRAFPPPPTPGFYSGSMSALANNQIRIVTSSFTGSNLLNGYNAPNSVFFPAPLVNNFYTPLFFVTPDGSSQGYNFTSSHFSNPGGESVKVSYKDGRDILILEDPPYNAGYTATCSFSIPFSASSAINQNFIVQLHQQITADSSFPLIVPGTTREYFLKPENFPNGIVTGSFEGEYRIGKTNIALEYTKSVNEIGKPYIQYTDQILPILDSSETTINEGGIHLAVSSYGLTDVFTGYYSPVQYSNPNNLPNPQVLENEGFHEWEIFIHPTWNMTPNDTSIPGYTSPFKAYSYTLNLGFPYPSTFWSWSDNLSNLSQPLLSATISGSSIFTNNGIVEQNHTIFGVDQYNIFRVDNNDFYTIDNTISQSIWNNFQKSIPATDNKFLYKKYSWSETPTNFNTFTFPEISWSTNTRTGDGSEDVFHREYVVPTNVTRHKNNPYLDAETGYLVSNDNYPPYYSIPSTASGLVVSDTIHAPQQDIELVVFKSPGKGTYEICAEVDLVAWAALPSTWRKTLTSFESDVETFQAARNVTDTFTFKLHKQSLGGTITPLEISTVSKNRRDYESVTRYSNVNPVPFFEGGGISSNNINFDPIFQDEGLDFGFTHINSLITANPEYEQYEAENQVDWWHYLHCWSYNTGPIESFKNRPLLFAINLAIQLDQLAQTTSIFGVYESGGPDTVTYQGNWSQTSTFTDEFIEYQVLTSGEGVPSEIWESTLLPPAPVLSSNQTATVFAVNTNAAGQMTVVWRIRTFAEGPVWAGISVTEHNPFWSTLPSIGLISYWAWFLNPFAYFEPPGLPDGCDCQLLMLRPEDRAAAGCLATNPHTKCLSYELEEGDIIFMTVSVKNGTYFVQDRNNIYNRGTGIRRVKEADIRYLGFTKDTLLKVRTLPQLLETPVTLAFTADNGNASLSISNESFPGVSPLGCFEVDPGVKIANTGMVVSDGGFLNLGTLYSENPNLPFINTEGNFISCSASNVISVGHNLSTGGDNTFNIGINSEINGFNNLSAGQNNVIATFSTSSQIVSSSGGNNVCLGDSNIVNGFNSLGQGHSSQIYGSYTHGEGEDIVINGVYSHAEGKSNQVENAGNHIEGYQNNIAKVSANSHAEGQDNTILFSFYNHAEGYKTSLIGGNASHVEGDSTAITASLSTNESRGSHAEGYGTQISSSRGAHAEGYNTKITKGSAYSHAEGKNTLVERWSSHAEGTLTTSSGKFSHAEGYNTQTLSNYSHTEGHQTQTKNRYAHAEGINTTASADFSHTEGRSTQTSAKYSHAEGFKTLTLGESSHAEGFRTFTKNDYSHAEGYLTSASATSHAEGLVTKASGFYSHAEGYSNKSSGQFSHAEGRFTTSSGQSSHAEGSFTQASSYYSHAEGRQTIASDTLAHAEGFYTIASGLASHAEGFQTTASGKYSHAEGSYITSSGEGSHAEGTQNSVLNDYSHVEGDQNTVQTRYAHAEGTQNTITSTSTYGHAEGFKTLADNVATHTEGFLVTASGTYSHAEGYLTQTASPYAHAEGRESIAKDPASHASGIYTTASWDYTSTRGIRTEPLGFTIISSTHHTGSLTVGRYNDNQSMGGYNFTTGSKSQFVIGAGTSVSDRKNLAEFTFEDILFNINFLPTSDPSKIGQLYRDGGIIKISLG